jgi:hypothetical protein
MVQCVVEEKLQQIVSCCELLNVNGWKLMLGDFTRWFHNIQTLVENYLVHMKLMLCFAIITIEYQLA